MSFLLKIDKSDYETLFKVDKNDPIKNLIIDFINHENNKKKKVIPSKNGVNIKKIKQLIKVKYSTCSGNKIDVTNLILRYLIVDNIKNEKIKTNINEITLVANYFNDFLYKYISFFCKKCHNEDNNKSNINSYLQSILKYDIKMIDNFFEDTEHGFFHGLMVSFICYVINDDKNLVGKKNNLEQLFISTTMHDFLKTNGVPQKEHDIKLKQYYPKLCDETYVHSDPPEKYFKKHLIIADRLELRRYPDFYSWVDQRFHKLYKQMTPKTKSILDTFYTIYRPGLEYIFKQREKVFVRYGSEVSELSMSNIFPPNKEGKKTYPIEIDTIPFSSIINNEIIWFKDSNQNGYCLNHDGNTQCKLIEGYISMDNFTKSGKVIRNKDKNHLDANSNINTKNWFFVYQNIEKCFNLKNKTRKYFQSLSQLIENKNMVLSQESVFLIFHFFKIFKCRIVALRKL